MKPKKHNEQMAQECPDSTLLLRYAMGECSVLESTVVETHIQKCECCSAELEGLLMLENPTDIEQISQQLNDQVDTVLLRKKRRSSGLIVIRWLSGAAIIALMLGSYFLIRQATMGDPPVLTRNTTTSEGNTKTELETLSSDTNASGIKAPLTPLLISHQDYTKIEEVQEDMATDVLMEESNRTSEAVEFEMDKSVDKTENVKSIQFEENSGGIGAANKNGDETSVSTGKSLKDRREWKKAEKSDKKEMNRAPVSMAEMDDKSLWNQTIELIRKDKPEEARKKLQILIERNGQYSDSAKIKLREIAR